MAYGGDLRQGGFTEQLIDLIRYYNVDGLKATERFRSYLAYPIYGTLTAAQEAEVKPYGSFKKTKPPQGLSPQDVKFLQDPSVQDIPADLSLCILPLFNQNERKDGG